MIEPLLGLPSHLRRRLVDALDSEDLAPPYTAAALRTVLGLPEVDVGVVEGMNRLAEAGVRPPVAAAWLRSVDQATSKVPRPDLVWSGPEVAGLHARNTRGVFEELVDSAAATMWVSTYAFFDGPKAFERLARRIDSVEGLEVTLLLNIQRKWGDTTAANQLIRSFADRFWKKDWPGKRRPRVFYDPRALALEGPAGVLHAKAMVVDESVVLVTSANLTEAAFDRNIEMGLLVRDGALAASLSRHFRVLIEQGLLLLLPGE